MSSNLIAQTYTKFDISNSGIQNNYIQSSCEDQNGVLWFGTRSGISSFNGKDWTLYNSSNSIISGTIGQIIAKDSMLFAISFSSPLDNNFKQGVIYKFDGNKWDVLLKSNSETYTGLDLDTKKNIWISTIPNGLIKLSGSNVTYFKRSDGFISSDSIWSVKVDSKGNKWLGSWKNGLIKFNDSQSITYNTNSSSICSDFIKCLYYDKINNLILAGSWDGCISKFSLDKVQIESFNSKNSGLLLEKIETITEYGGRYWFGAISLLQNHKGAFSWDGKYTWTNYSPNPVVYSISPYKSMQKIILGTPMGAYLLDLPNAGNFNINQIDKKNDILLLENNFIIIPNILNENKIYIYKLNGQLFKCENLEPKNNIFDLNFLPPNNYVIKVGKKSKLINIH